VGPHPIRPRPPHPHLPGEKVQQPVAQFISEASPLAHGEWARAITSCSDSLPGSRTWYACGHAEKAPVDLKTGRPIG
jgi:hypothetical protein